MSLKPARKNESSPNRQSKHDDLRDVMLTLKFRYFFYFFLETQKTLHCDKCFCGEIAPVWSSVSSDIESDRIKKFRMNESDCLPVLPLSSSSVRGAHFPFILLRKSSHCVLFSFFFLRDAKNIDINNLLTSHLVYWTRHTVGVMYS